MRNRLLAVAGLAALAFTSVSAQRLRRVPESTARDRDAAQDREFRFSPDLRSGDRLSVSNIAGAITITQSNDRTTQIVVNRIVRRGDGSIVTARLERTRDGFRVCTVYAWSGRDDTGCQSESHHDDYGRHEPLDVQMKYEIRIPSGVELDVTTVDSPVDARGIDTPGSIRTVDGSITYQGVAPEALNTVDGGIDAEFTNTSWQHDVSVRSVDGGIDVTLPRSVSATVTGSSVDGGVRSDFPMTIAGKWGPRAFSGTIGNGRGGRLTLTTVDGGIRLRRAE